MSSLVRNSSETQAKYLTVLPDDNYESNLSNSPVDSNSHTYDEPKNFEQNETSTNMNDTYVEPNPKGSHASEAQAVFSKSETGYDVSAFTGSDEERKETKGSKVSTRLIFIVIVIVLLAVVLSSVITYFVVKASNNEDTMEKSFEIDSVKDQEYVVMFTKNYKASVCQLLVTVQVTELQIYMNGKVENETVNSVAGLRKSLDDQTTGDNAIQSKGILLKTSNDVSIYGISTYQDGAEHCCSSDGFAAIPVEYWGRQYKVITLSEGSFKKQIGVVSLYDKTDITFNLNKTGKEETTKTVTLDRLQTYQLSRDSDLTGSTVTGTKHFGVFSGDECGYYNGSGCSYMIENIPKFSDWGNVYIVPKFKNITSLFVKIVPSASNAVLTFVSGSKTRVYQTNGYLQVDLDTDIPVLIYGDSAFLVAAYGSYDKQFYFMTLVPSLCQYSNHLILITTSLKNFHNFVSVIIQEQHAKDLVFDNKNFSSFDTEERKLIFENTTWRVILFQIPSDRMKYLLYHPNSNVKFGVIQYGVDTHYMHDNYAYPVGLNLKDIQQSCKYWT